ncbi:hypothetical protein SUGI_0564480 [Cryptomeria japonica]|nr:hypothetical protein SUGI_0564480 [Cryptomeria japonica]
MNFINILFQDSKQKYHCHGCGICRIGSKDHFFHCYKCGLCYVKKAADINEVVYAFPLKMSIMEEVTKNNIFKFALFPWVHVKHFHRFAQQLHQGRIIPHQQSRGLGQHGRHHRRHQRTYRGINANAGEASIAGGGGRTAIQARTKARTGGTSMRASLG